jgi:hypothetical protein
MSVVTLLASATALYVNHVLKSGGSAPSTTAASCLARFGMLRKLFSQNNSLNNAPGIPPTRIPRSEVVSILDFWKTWSSTL